MPLIIGIDPGITGAIAWYRDGKIERVTDMPTVEVKVGKGMRRQMVPAVLADLLDVPGDCLVFLEQVATRPGEGAVGAFSFGRGFGQIEGVLATLGLSYTLVHPKTWKAALKVPADKGSAVAIACRQFPAMASQFMRPSKASKTKTVEEDGRAEAALIALYGASL